MIDRFARKHVLLFGIILFLAVMPGVWALLVLPLKGIGGVWAEAICYAASAAAAAAFLLFVWREKVVRFGTERFWESLFTYGLVGLIGAAGALAFSFEGVDRIPGVSAVLGCVALNLSIAVCEELLFRGMIFGAMLRAWEGRKNGVTAAVLASSALFGMRHLLGLVTSPGQPMLALAQVVFCFMAGTYLCALYLRSHSLWVGVAVHFIEDICASVWPLFSTAAAASAAKDISLGNAAMMIAFQIPYAVVAWLMLRGGKEKLVTQSGKMHSSV